MQNVKVNFNLSSDNIDNASTESLWAIPGAGSYLVLDNIPFHIKGVSLGDTISCKLRDETIFFDKIEKKGGHSTYRILQLIDNPKAQFAEYWRPIATLGATFESKVDGERILYAVDFPPHSDVKSAFKLLEKGEKDGVWHFEEGDYFAG